MNIKTPPKTDAINSVLALNWALHDAMEADPSVIAFGEEVAQLLAGELLDDQAEQQEVRVAVEEAAARREVEMVVAHAGGQKVL